MKTTNQSPVIGAFLLSISTALMANAATVTWDGGGNDKSWHNPRNWGADKLPSVTDDAVVGNVAVEAGSGVQIQGLRLAAGASITVKGAGVEFVANGETVVDGAKLVALDEVKIRLCESFAFG